MGGLFLLAAAALKCCQIAVGVAVASVNISNAASAISHSQAAGVCQNTFLSASVVALCPKGGGAEEPVVTLPLAAGETSNVAPETMESEAYTPSSFLQRTLSRFSLRCYNVTPSCNSAPNNSNKRIMAVVAIAVGLILPVFFFARRIRKKRQPKGNNPGQNVERKWVSESIQERQHQLLSATNSDPVRTRTCDAPSVPASKHPQFAMPMSKPVLLRAQNNTKASVADPTVTQHKLQQPRRLEKELAFGEVQWTQVPSNSHPQLTTSTPNEPPAIRSQRFLARQCGQRSFKYPPAAASGIDVRKSIAASNNFNGSFNSVLPPSEETSVVVERQEVSEGAPACRHDDRAFQEQQCDPAATIYETIETGGEWASNEDGDGQKWPQEKHGEGNFETDNAVEECGSSAWIDEPDAEQNTILQVEGENLEQECIAGEEAWNSVLTTGDNAVERMGNNTVEQTDAAATINETLENEDEWASNHNDGHAHTWPQEKHGNAEGDFEADEAVDECGSAAWIDEPDAQQESVEAADAVEECGSVAWIDEPEPDTQQGSVEAADAVEECGSVAWIDEPQPDDKHNTISQVEGENLQDGCAVGEEGAWSTVLVTDDNAVKSLKNGNIEWAEDDAEKIPQTQGTGETEVAEQEELRGTVATSSIEDVEDIYVDDDDLNESNPNMMLTRRASVTDDEDGIGEMIGFPRVPVLPDHESILSMDIPSTGPTSLRSNCTDPTDTEDDDEVGGDSGTGGVSTHEDKSTVSAKAVTTAAAKKKADTFAQLTSKEELSQAKLILVNDRA